MFWRCKNTCCKNWHHLLSKSSISLSFGHSASGVFSSALMFINVHHMFGTFLKETSISWFAAFCLFKSSSVIMISFQYAHTHTDKSVLGNTASMGPDTSIESAKKERSNVHAKRLCDLMKSPKGFWFKHDSDDSMVWWKRFHSLDSTDRCTIHLCGKDATNVANVPTQMILRCNNSWCSHLY